MICRIGELRYFNKLDDNKNGVLDGAEIPEFLVPERGLELSGYLSWKA